MSISRTSLQRAHGRAITVELVTQGRSIALAGTGHHADGRLRIDVKDSAGGFTLYIDDTTFDGEIVTAGDSFRIRLSALG
jgi:hypothetical protein